MATGPPPWTVSTAEGAGPQGPAPSFTYGLPAYPPAAIAFANSTRVLTPNPVPPLSV